MHPPKAPGHKHRTSRPTAQGSRSISQGASSTRHMTRMPGWRAYPVPWRAATHQLAAGVKPIEALVPGVVAWVRGCNPLEQDAVVEQRVPAKHLVWRELVLYAILQPQGQVQQLSCLDVISPLGGIGSRSCTLYVDLHAHVLWHLLEIGFLQTDASHPPACMLRVGCA